MRSLEKKTARTCFIVGSIAVFVLFLFLTLWTLASLPDRTKSYQLEQNSDIVEGKRIWQSYACVDCHTILGNGAYYAPDLTKVYKTRGEKWLRRWLTDPIAMDPVTIMPNLHIKPGEVPKLIAFFEWVNGIDTSGWPPSPLRRAMVRPRPAKPSIERGEKLFTEKGCDGCHMLKGAGTEFGPDLTGVGSRRDKAWLDRWLKDPTAVKPDAAMPQQDLTNEERASLVEFLASQK